MMALSSRMKVCMAQCGKIKISLTFEKFSSKSIHVLFRAKLIPRNIDFQKFVKGHFYTVWPWQWTLVEEEALKRISKQDQSMNVLSIRWKFFKLHKTTKCLFLGNVKIPKRFWICVKEITFVIRNGET